MDILSYMLGKKASDAKQDKLPTFNESSYFDAGKVLTLFRNPSNNYKNEIAWERPFPTYDDYPDEGKVLTVMYNESTDRNYLSWEAPQDGHPREVYHAISGYNATKQRHIFAPNEDEGWVHLSLEHTLGNLCLVLQHPNYHPWIVLDAGVTKINNVNEYWLFCATVTQNGGILGRTYYSDNQGQYGDNDGEPFPFGTMFGTETVLLPEHTVSDAGKYLKVDANGSLEWGT